MFEFLQNSKRKLNTEISALRVCLSNVINERDRALSKNKELESELQAVRNILTTSTECSELEKEKTRLFSDINQYDKILHEKRQQFDLHHAQLLDLLQDIEKYSEELKIIESCISEKQEFLADIQSRIDLENTDLTLLQACNDTLSKDISEKERIISSYEERIANHNPLVWTEQYEDIESEYTDTLSILKAECDKYDAYLESIRLQIKSYEEAIQKKTSEYDKLCIKCNNIRDQVIEHSTVLEEIVQDYNNYQRKNEIVLSKAESYFSALARKPEYTLFAEEFYDARRIEKALSYPAEFIRNVSMSAQIISEETGEVYNTTLFSCTCRDHTYRHTVCKHMYALAAYQGVLICKNTDELYEKIKQYSELVEADKRYKEGIDRIVKAKSQRFPALSKMFSKLDADLEEQLAYELETKRSPAQKSADEIRKVSKEKRKYQIKCKSLDYQLTYLKSLFPWIEDFITKQPFDEDIEEMSLEENQILAENPEYIEVRKWLSFDDYIKLPNAEKYQLALDRYVARKNKSPWEVGIEYEQYIGFKCESEGFSVEYRGARDKLQDMGRDLIVKKDDSVYVIQCKRWHQSKQIHEKHIFQLFGSVTQYRYEHPGTTCIPVFVTSSTLTDCASDIAKMLDVKVYQNIPFDNEYPRIKCNVTERGEKIYHLPFDQQYNNVIFNTHKNKYSDDKLYVSTTAEAESLGFRRAMRHVVRN